jgi:hypothetical protein
MDRREEDELMKRALVALLMAAGLLVATGPQASADPCQYGSDTGGGGVNVGGACAGGGTDTGGSDSGSTGGGGPSGPVYEDYYTPACSFNGPPGQGGDVMCMGATSICDTQGQPDALYMQHWQREVFPDQGTWKLVGSECRGPNEPTTTPPVVTEQMVVDAAYAAAPKPAAMVQPGTRSFVNIPNNYYADAQDQTVDVNVLGNTIAVTFKVESVSWDFGDSTSGEGVGAKDARVGAPGAVEHAYARQGDYSITATTSLGVQFTLPTGQQVNTPGAIEMTSPAVVLPVSEIQTRVDSVS